MRILCDVDGVIANFVEGFMYLYESYGGGVPDGFVWKDWDSMDELPDQMVRDSVWRDPDLFWILEPYDGAIEALKKLNDRFDVRIVTAVPHKHIEPRSDWFKLHAPFIHRKNQMIFTNDKALLRADYIVDDKVEYVDDWLEENVVPRGGAFLIDRPWNRHGKNGKRVASLDAVVGELTWA